jgi:nucleoside-diphosphate-sugar epimerase
MGLSGEKILITGATSQVAFPLARALAADNEVHGLARLGRRGDRERLSAVGVTCVPVDLATDPLADLPEDFTYVLNFAVVKTGAFDYDLAANVESVGRLMSRCRRAKAFLHCSSGAVYQFAGHRALKETDPLGDNHRVMFPTYSISKIAAECMVRFGARQWGLPAVIARLSVPYGSNGGWPWFHLMMLKQGQPIPVHPDGPSVFNPIHEDDYIAQVPRLLAIAAVPPVTLNWGGSEAVSIEEWCGYLGELTGLEVKFRATAETLESVCLDVSRMHELVGETTVSWRDGFRRLVEAFESDLAAR